MKIALGAFNLLWKITENYVLLFINIIETSKVNPSLFKVISHLGIKKKLK